MSNNEKHPIAIIGGGLGGLAAACTLAARGHSVVLFERNPWLGGKAAILEKQGFRFDMGPTILTLPSVLRRIFEEAGRPMSDYLQLHRLDPQWRSFFADGAMLDLSETPNQMAAALETFAPGKGLAQGYARFLELSEQLHRVSDKYFFWRPVGRLRDMLDWRASFQPGVVRDVFSMRMGQSVADTVRAFVPEKRVAQMMDHFTQYVGSAPDTSPAVLCGIAHMQISEGVWYPRGGTGAVPRALATLARELGVRTELQTGIRRIRSERGIVVAVETDRGEVIPVKAVVSNCDSVRTHRELLGRESSRPFESRRWYEPACSGVVLYLGLKQRYHHLQHHNFIFSRDPEEEFDWIYQTGEPAPDPTCYVCAPSVSEPEVAPPNGEALYVLVHTPYLRSHHDWTTMLPPYRETIMKKLASAGMEDIRERIVFEQVLTPEDIHRRYHVLNGAIYGLASHGKFLGAFKPSNRSPDLKGLYLAGGAAHPGPGMPMVLMSGWIAADALDADARSGHLAVHERPRPQQTPSFKS